MSSIPQPSSRFNTKILGQISHSAVSKSNRFRKSDGRNEVMGQQSRSLWDIHVPYFIYVESVDPRKGRKTNFLQGDICCFARNSFPYETFHGSKTDKEKCTGTILRTREEKKCRKYRGSRLFRYRATSN